MALISTLLDKKRIKHVLEAEREHIASLPEEGRGAYVPTVFWIEPPTADEMALFRDQVSAGFSYQACLSLVRRRLKAVDDLRNPDGSDYKFDEDDPAKGLRTKWVLSVAAAIERMADPDEEDFV